jgi:DNA-binding CsgD family transcriptional regulator
MQIKDRDKQILLHILEDKSYAEIGATMFMHPDAVKKRISNLIKKLGCRTRVGLIKRLLEAGIFRIILDPEINSLAS